MEADKELNKGEIIKTSLHFRILSNYTYYTATTEPDSAVRIPMTEDAQLALDLNKLNLSLSDEALQEWEIESERRREEIEIDKERILLELGVRESAAKKEKNHKALVLDIGTAITKIGASGREVPSARN